MINLVDITTEELMHNDVHGYKPTTKTKTSFQYLSRIKIIFLIKIVNAPSYQMTMAYIPPHNKPLMFIR